MSAKKVQLCTSETTYLDYRLKGRTRSLSQSRIATILQLPTPKTKTQVWEFVGAARYCCLWISEFVEKVRPLCTNTKWGIKSLIRTETKVKAFEALKITLTSAPVLEFPDVSKPFYLFVHETRDKRYCNPKFGAMEMPYKHICPNHCTRKPWDGPPKSYC